MVVSPLKRRRPSKLTSEAGSKVSLLILIARIFVDVS